MSQPVQIVTPSSTQRGCGCGAHDDETPVIDVLTLPHAVRHAAIIGAFEAIPEGGSLVIVAPHAPRPLLAQLARRATIGIEYLVEGPDSWHVQVTRLAPAQAEA